MTKLEILIKRKAALRDGNTQLADELLEQTLDFPALTDEEKYILALAH